MFCSISLTGEKPSAELQCKSKDSSYSFKTKKQPQKSRGGGEGGAQKSALSHRNKAKCKEHVTLSEKNFYEQFLLFIMLLNLGTGQTALAVDYSPAFMFMSYSIHYGTVFPASEGEETVLSPSLLYTSKNAKYFLEALFQYQSTLLQTEKKRTRPRLGISYTCKYHSLRASCVT